MAVLKRYIRSHIAPIALLILFVIFLLAQATIEDKFLLFMAFFVGAIICGSTVANSNSRSSIKTFGLTAALCLAGFGSFNYIVNPFALYTTHFIEPLTVATRNLKMNLYAAASPRPEAVILGSSRSFTVDTNEITKLWHYTAVNLSVASGTMRDDLALLHFMMENGKMPTLLIINLSPERFATFDFRAAEPDSPLWNYLDDDTRISNLQLSVDRWTFLFSREQFEASVRLIQAKLLERQPAATGYFDNTGVMRNDTRHPKDDDFNLEKLEKNSWTGWFNEAINPNMEAAGMMKLKQILEIAKAQNMLVIGYTPPVHPLFKDFLDTHTDFEHIRTRINEQINALTQNYSFYFTDFMDDEHFSDGQTMYHDHVHPTLETSTIMMQTLYDQYNLYRQMPQ
jgi:hypothetical protein